MATAAPTQAKSAAPVLRPSVRYAGQAYRCPECAALFELSTNKWRHFLEHIHGQHPGATQPKRKDAGILVYIDLDGAVIAKYETPLKGKCYRPATLAWCEAKRENLALASGMRELLQRSCDAAAPPPSVS